MDKEIHRQSIKSDQQAPLFSASQNIMDVFTKAMQNGEKIELVPFRKWQNLRGANIDLSRAGTDSADNKANFNQAI